MDESRDSSRHNKLNSKTGLLRNSNPFKISCLQMCPSVPTFVSDVVFITSFNVLSGYVYVSHNASLINFVTQPL